MSLKSQRAKLIVAGNKEKTIEYFANNCYDITNRYPTSIFDASVKFGVTDAKPVVYTVDNIIEAFKTPVLDKDGEIVDYTVVPVGGAIVVNIDMFETLNYAVEKLTLLGSACRASGIPFVYDITLQDIDAESLKQLDNVKYGQVYTCSTVDIMHKVKSILGKQADVRYVNSVRFTSETQLGCTAECAEKVMFELKQDFAEASAAITFTTKSDDGCPEPMYVGVFNADGEALPQDSELIKFVSVDSHLRNILVSNPDSCSNYFKIRELRYINSGTPLNVILIPENLAGEFTLNAFSGITSQPWTTLQALFINNDIIPVKLTGDFKGKEASLLADALLTKVDDDTWSYNPLVAKRIIDAACIYNASALQLLGQKTGKANNKFLHWTKVFTAKNFAEQNFG